MLRRPLILILICFSGGILAGHSLFSSNPPLGFFIALLTIAALIFAFFLPVRYKTPCFLILFFGTGFLVDLGRHRETALSPLADERQKVLMEGTILTPPQIRQDTARVLIRADRVFLERVEKRFSEKILLRVYGYPRSFLPGDRVRFPQD